MMRRFVKGRMLVWLFAMPLALPTMDAFAGRPELAESADRARQRLQREESFSLEKFSVGTGSTLERNQEAASQNFRPGQQQPIRVDVRKALADIAEQASKKTDDGSSDRKLSLSIAEARKMALENNLSLRVASLEPAIAETALGEERAKFDNIIFAKAKLKSTDAPSIAAENVKFSSTNPALNGQSVKLTKEQQTFDVFEAEAGVKIPLRTGGVVTLSSPFERKKTQGTLSSDEYRSALRFSISQPLLRNAGVRVNEASIRIAGFEQQAVNVKARLQSIRVISLIDKAYWELYAAWADLDVSRQQYELASQNLFMVRRRVEEGLTAAIEVRRAEIGVADRVEALIVAKTRLKLAQRQLKFLLNGQDLALDSEVNIIPTTAPALTNYALDRKRIASEALDGRLELLELELKLAADLAKIEYLENQTLPLFTLDYSYGALSSSRGNFGQAYGDISDNRFNDWAVGLRFELPMTNQARRMQLQGAVQQRIQRLTTKTLQEQTVRREIYDMLDLTEQSWQRMLAARQQVILAGLNYEAELKQFKEGLRTMTEVLEMLSLLGKAQSKEISAVKDYQVALIDLAYATGTLLGYSRVELNINTPAPAPRSTGHTDSQSDAR